MNTRSVSVLGLGLGATRAVRPCAGSLPAHVLLPCARRAVAIPRRARSTSFWSTSYPAPIKELSGKLPAPPPLPAPSAVTQTEESDRQRARRQQRYLDSLMNKAGEVGLQCEPDAPGEADARLDPRRERQLDRRGGQVQEDGPVPRT